MNPRNLFTPCLSTLSLALIIRGASAQTPASPPPPAPANPPAGPGLDVQVSGEEPTGVFFDRDTIAPQTPVLFTARIDNNVPDAREIQVTWRVTDSLGAEDWKQSATFTIAGNDSIVRRELFDPPARGGYNLQVTAHVRHKGADATAEGDLPFAVTIAPLPTTVDAVRPQSFFVLNTPAQLSGGELDFYSRIGARVLRSPLPDNPSNPDWTAVESQLDERLKRNLASIAYLPVTEAGPRSSETYFSRQVPSNLARFTGLTTWELGGDVSQADLDGWSQIARTRRSDLLLLGPVPAAAPGVGSASLGTDRARELDGATFEWPTINAVPMALRRMWLARADAAKSAGLAAYHLRREDDLTDTGASPAAVAGELTADYLGAIASGASSMSETLNPPDTAIGDSGPRAMAEAAAFAMMTRTLEDASYRELLFPNSPALDGSLFRAQHGSMAVLYATSGTGQLTAHITPAHCFDLFGNPVGSQSGDSLTIPLSGQPVYVVTDQSPDVLAFALRDGQLSGITPLAAQVLPLSRAPGVVESDLTYVRVRLENIGLGDRSGHLTIAAPKGWKFAEKGFDYHLAQGETRTYEFRALQTRLSQDGLVPLKITAASGHDKYIWTQNAPVVTADNVQPGQEITVDGDLSDWAGANWMSAGPDANHIGAKLALRWDANNLYLAAQVQEPGLAARRPDEPAYEFWRDHDALQLAFGTADGPDALPGPEPFHDSDRGFLICAFNQHASNEFDGRVLLLWSPDKPYGTVADHVRWGGMVPGSYCAIHHDEKAGTTIYEARIPLSAIPELNPAQRTLQDGIVRFGWLLHNNEGPPLDWGKLVGNFPWWDNTDTFMPPGELTSALRSTLGFTQVGTISGGSPAGPALPPPTPVGAITPAPTPAAPPASDGGSVTLPPPPASPPDGAVNNLPPSAGAPSAGTPPAGTPPAGTPPAGVAPDPSRRNPPQIPPYMVPPAPAPAPASH